MAQMQSLNQPSKAPSTGGMLFRILGCVMLASWNFYLTCVGFFMLWFPGCNWAFLASIVYQAANVLGTSFMVKFGHRVPFKTGYVISLLAQMCLIVALPALAFFSGSSNGTMVTPSSWGINCALAACAALGLAESVTTALIFGLAGALDDPKMMLCVSSGQGVVGVICPILMLSLKFLSGDPMEWKTEVVFGFFGCCFALQAVGICIVNRIPLVPTERAEHESPEEVLVSDPEGARRMELKQRGLKELFIDASPQLANVFLTFIVTFVVFPGVAASWSPQSGVFKGELGQAWYTTCVMGTFQVFDVIGRSSTGYMVSMGLMTETRLWIPAWTRLLFVPIFIVLQRSPGLIPVPYQDFVELAVMALFALTNGWVATMGMMYGPQRVKDPAEQHTVGIFLGLGTVIGIFLGSLLALLTQIGL